MKRFFIYIFSFILIIISVMSGCGKKIDYKNYVSEKRTDIYFYSDDNLTIKIYKSEREAPFNADGIKGDVTPFCEIFCYFNTNPEIVKIEAGTVLGEMNYNSVKNCFYLSFGEDIYFGESVEIKLNLDEKIGTYTATNVVESSTLTWEEALLCAVEHNRDLFENLSENGIFNGEIFIRLLYDEGCFYYVGVCDKNKKITAYLVDGENGKIIAEKVLEN